MNIEPDIFDYLETTSLEPHDDYTSEITYKDQKIIWKRLKEKDKEIERLNNIINELEKYLNEQIQKSWEIEEQCYEDIESKLQELKGDGSNEL